jgi:NAD(P)-dependent dehydrogenase (short-subunit alcohol dehydrogenase family)
MTFGGNMSVVLITGCSSGFGLEAAIAFAKRGDTVVATMRNLDKRGELDRRAEAAGVAVEIEQLDVLDQTSIENACRAVLNRHGAVDVLVNNAGVGFPGAVETIPFERARALFDTNFWGPLLVARAVLPAMRDRRSGVIVNVTSLAGRLPGLMYGGMYSASKQALGALSEALAGEVDPFGIRVVCVEPGFFSTEITNNSFNDDAPSEAYELDEKWFRSFMEASVGDGADPAIVAEVIVGAAEDPGTPLHVPVGDDAAMYLDLYGQVGGYEGWIEATLPVVESVVGARPIVD